MESSRKRELRAEITQLKHELRYGRKLSLEDKQLMRQRVDKLTREYSIFGLKEEMDEVNEFRLKNPDLLKEELGSFQSKFTESVKRVEKFPIIFDCLNRRIKSLRDLSDRVFSDLTKAEISSQNASEDLYSVDSLVFGSKLINDTVFLECSRIVSYFRSFRRNAEQFKAYVRELEMLVDFFFSDTKVFGFVYLTEAIFDEASDFSGGYGEVRIGQDSYVVDFNGTIFSEQSDVDKITSFKVDRKNPNCFPFEQMGSSLTSRGYMGDDGRVLIDPIFEYAGTFLNGFARVSKGKKIKDLSRDYDVYFFGLVDGSGNWVLMPEFIELGDVFNDVVVYKKYIYSEGYVRKNDYTDDVKYQVIRKGLKCGYMKFQDIKDAIFSTLSRISMLDDKRNGLNKSGDINQINEMIHREFSVIDFFLKFIVSREISRSESIPKSVSV